MQELSSNSVLLCKVLPSSLGKNCAVLGKGILSAESSFAPDLLCWVLVSVVYASGHSCLHSNTGLPQMLPVVSNFGVAASLPCGITLVGENIILSACWFFVVLFLCDIGCVICSVTIPIKVLRQISFFFFLRRSISSTEVVLSKLLLNIGAVKTWPTKEL